MAGMNLPPNFAWGVASSAYQIEGAADLDGKGPSVWDIFSHTPGTIAGGHHGDIACDHYHRYEEDVAIMHDLGLRNYRFSISWPRVMPDGTGSVNPRGLDFYDRLVDSLLAAEIRPWVTLFHWDFPQALMATGGWLARGSADWFAEYARVVADRLSDRVGDWFTLNEPQCFLGFGHATGTNAPGLRLDLADCLLAGHHALLAHGRAVAVLRAHASKTPNIGWAPVGVAAVPDDPENPEDVAAALQAMRAIGVIPPPSPEMPAHLWSNTWWCDPVILGHYPEDGVRLAGARMPDLEEGDMETISQPIDFLATNIYSGTRVKMGSGGKPEIVPHGPEVPLTGFHWPVVPESLRWGPRFLHEQYGLPVIIAENGLALPDWVALDGKVHDFQRVDFLTRYLRELGKAIADGARIDGYFHWSILDNFEWAEGYRQRFGLVHVDYQTRRRIPKQSASWFAGLVRANRIP